MNLEDIMTRDVVTVHPGTALIEVRKLLHQRGFHHLIVVEDDEVVGVISDRDVLQSISPFLDTLTEEPRDVHTLSRTAREIMRAPAVIARRTTTVDEAAKMLIEHKISCLPVLAAKGALEGIVTSKDILKHYIEN